MWLSVEESQVFEFRHPERIPAPCSSTPPPPPAPTPPAALLAEQEAQLAAACLQAVAANPTAVARIRAAVAASRRQQGPGGHPDPAAVQAPLEQMVSAFVHAIVETQVCTWLVTGTGRSGRSLGDCCVHVAVTLVGHCTSPAINTPQNGHAADGRSLDAPPGAMPHQRRRAHLGGDSRASIAAAHPPAVSPHPAAQPLQRRCRLCRSSALGAAAAAAAGAAVGCALRHPAQPQRRRRHRCVALRAAAEARLPVPAADACCRQ